MLLIYEVTLPDTLFRCDPIWRCYRKFDKSGKGVIIYLYVDDMLIFGTNQVQVDLTTDFLSSRFFMKDMRDDDVILGIRIKHESNGIEISQSHYIEKELKKFNYFNCTPFSTSMDTSEKLMPNNGQAVSQLEYYRVIGCLMYVMTYTKPDIAFVVGKLGSYPSVLEGYIGARWISNTKENSSTSGWVFLLGDDAIFWAFKKQTCITGSTMKYEFVALAAAGKEAECQMYNGKSRHLGVRRSMIRELITNGVVSIKFVRSQQNLADHLRNRLARDLIIKSTEGMGLNSMRVQFISVKGLEVRTRLSELLFSEAECNSRLNDIHQSDGFILSSARKLDSYEYVVVIFDFRLELVPLSLLVSGDVILSTVRSSTKHNLISPSYVRYQSDGNSLKFFDFNTSSLQERRTLESGTFTTIFTYHAFKQLAINLRDEYGFVIRPCLVGVTFESVRIDL
ncbi:zinc finger, CCHC-type containing protein [Tanacetum coccineum]